MLVVIRFRCFTLLVYKYFNVDYKYLKLIQRSVAPTLKFVGHDLTTKYLYGIFK